MTYRELIEYCWFNDHCEDCEHLKECEAFKNKLVADIPCDLYKLLYSEFSFDDEIEV